MEKYAARNSLRATLAAEAPKGPNPVEATDANLIAGIELYRTHCVVCHGSAKGKSAMSAIAKGEYPSAPQLASDGVEDDPQGRTFWKIKHGIRWTGMPSWKYELDDGQIWTLALFLKPMDKLPPAAEAAWKALPDPTPAAGDARQRPRPRRLRRGRASRLEGRVHQRLGPSKLPAVGSCTEGRRPPASTGRSTSDEFVANRAV